MNPIIDLRGEHDTMVIILTAMKKMVSDILKKTYVDLFRISQVIEFLRTYNHCCHHEKEEKIFFPALLEFDIPWTADTIALLVNEHLALHRNLLDVDQKLQEYISGRSRTLDNVANSMTKYISLSENHITTENQVLLPLAERTLCKKRQDAIISDFRQIQDTRIGHTKHLEYYILLTKLYSDVKVSYVDEI